MLTATVLGLMIGLILSGGSAVNICSLNDVAFAASGQISFKTYYMPYALEAWVDNVVTNVPEVYYTYYWYPDINTLLVAFYNAGPESGYVTYTVYFKTAGFCPTEPPKTDTVILKLYKAKVVNSSDFNPTSTKPASIKSTEVTLPLYKARLK